MASVRFDTHKLVRKLRGFGLEERQAEGIAEALKDLETGRDATTPHRDLDLVRQEVRDLEFRIDAKTQAIRGDLTAIKWMLFMIMAGVVALVVKFFF